MEACVDAKTVKQLFSPPSITHALFLYPNLNAVSLKV